MGHHAHEDHPHEHPDPETDPVAHWEEHYGQRERVWSGRVNPVLAAVAEDLAPGRALGVGSGEGADAVWLARRGWDVTALDISHTALARARVAADEAGVAAHVHLRQIDLARELPTGEYDLVSAQFFQSWLDLPREQILRSLAGLLVEGGRLLVVDHATVPPWSGHRHEDLPSVQETLDALALGPAYAVELAEARARTVTGEDAQSVEILDNVILVRRTVGPS